MAISPIKFTGTGLALVLSNSSYLLDETGGVPLETPFRPWVPSDLPVPPKIQLDAEQAVFSGDNLVSLPNPGSSGGSFEITSTAPTQGAVYNGITSIRADTQEKRLRIASSITSGSVSWFWLGQLTSYGTGAQTLFGQNWPSQFGGMAVYATLDTSFAGVFGFGNGYNDSHPTNITSQSPPSFRTLGIAVQSTTSPYMLSGQLGSDGNASFDNTVSRSLEINSVGALPSYTGNFDILCSQQNGSNSESLLGDTLALYVFDYTLTTDQRNRLEGWAAHKFGTTALLPITHPYKSYPPQIALNNVAGTLASNEDSDTLSASSSVRIVGTLASTEDSDTLVSTAAIRVSGTLASTEDNDTLSATGSFNSASLSTASLTGTEDNDTLLSATQLGRIPADFIVITQSRPIVGPPPIQIIPDTTRIVITVRPGLTANGMSTFDPTQSIPAANINSSDPYAIIEQIDETLG